MVYKSWRTHRKWPAVGAQVQAANLLVCEVVNVTQMTNSVAHRKGRKNAAATHNKPDCHTCDVVCVCVHCASPLRMCGNGSQNIDIPVFLLASIIEVSMSFARSQLRDASTDEERWKKKGSSSRPATDNRQNFPHRPCTVRNSLRNRYGRLQNGWINKKKKTTASTEPNSLTSSQKKIFNNKQEHLTKKTILLSDRSAKDPESARHQQHLPLRKRSTFHSADRGMVSKSTNGMRRRVCKPGPLPRHCLEPATSRPLPAGRLGEISTPVPRDPLIPQAGRASTDEEKSSTLRQDFLLSKTLNNSLGISV